MNRFTNETYTEPYTEKKFKEEYLTEWLPGPSSIPPARVARDMLRTEMKKDPSLAWAWHKSLADSIYDSMPDVFWLPDRTKLKEIANEGATVFMKRTFNVDTSENMLDKEQE